MPDIRRSPLLAVLLSTLLTVGLAFPAGRAGAQDADAVLRVITTSAADGAPLPGANVILSASEADVSRAGATDLDGFLELDAVPPGEYRIEVSFVGFETHRDTLTLRSGRRVYRVALSRQDRQLEEVRVEAERDASRRQAGLQSFGAADIARVPTPGPTGDLASYIQTLPGVVSGGSRGGQFNIRGGSANQNRVLVDGLPIARPFHISSFYSAFSDAVVRNVDLYAGGFGAEYLGSTSSVIDVTLRQGNMKEYAGGASISPFLSSARVEGPIEKGKRSFLGVVRRSTLRQTAGPLFGQDVPLTFYDLTGRYSVQLESATCSVTGVHTYDEGRINLDRNLDLSWSNTAAGGRCRVFGEGLANTLEIQGGFTRFNNAVGTSEASQRTAGYWKGYAGLEREQTVPWGTIDVGVRGTLAQYEYALGPKFTALNENTELSGFLRGHVSTRIDVGDRLTVSPSFGTQFSGQMQVPTYEPRLRLSFRPDGTERQEISIAAGKYHQVQAGLTDKRDAGTVFTVWTPTFKDNRFPEALHAILGYRQRVSDWLQVSVEGYGKDLANIPVPKWTPVARFNTEITRADGTAYGVDVRSTVEAGNLYLFAGYGWSRVTYRAGTDALGAWIDGQIFEYMPSHDRRHKLNTVLSYELGAFTANAAWEFVSGRPYTQVYGFDLALRIPSFADRPTTDPGTALTYYGRPYGARLPSFHRLDLSISRSFDLWSDGSMTAKVGAINTYDRPNVFYYDINTLERVNQTPFLPYASLRLTVN